MPSTVDFARFQIEEKPRYQGAPTTGAYEISTDAADLPIQSTALNPAPSHIDRSDELRGTEGGPPMLIETYEPAGAVGMRGYPNGLTWLLECAGFVGTRQAGAGTNEAQTITVTGSPAGGSFTVTWTSTLPGATAMTSGPIPYNATAAQVKAVLEATWGEGNFKVTGGPLPGTPIVVTFVGAYAAQNVILATTTDSLTGGTAPASVIATTTAGATGGVVDPDGFGVATGANLWTFVKRGGITAQTMQILLGYVDEGIFLRGQGYGVGSLGINADGAVSGDLSGLVVERIADPSISPVIDAASILPARRGDLYLNWMAGAGTVNDFSFTVANPLVRNRTLSLAQSSFFPDRLEHGDEKARGTGTIPMHSVTGVDFDALMAATTFAARARWKTNASQVGASGAPYGLWIVMPAAQYTGGGVDAMSNRRRFGGSFDFWAAVDDVAGYDLKIYLVNGVQAIRTGITP